MAKEILNINNLHVSYSAGKDTVRAVNGIDLMLNEGEALGLVGETGAGKTTTALSIMQLVPDPPGKITAGTIVFKGDELTKKKDAEMEKIRGREISMIFQDPMTALNPVKTVGDQIREVVMLHTKLSKDEATQRARAMMDLVGIEGERYGDYPHQFSGGMKQRIVIAIAIACRPGLLIADEPTTALDVTIQAQVLNLIRELIADLGMSLILITHDLGVVAQMCERVAIMYAGEIVEQGNLVHIYDETAHPYTQGLFDSIPDFSTKVERLKPIPGMMPDPTALPSGCVFADRCSHCFELCRQEHPPLYEISPNHLVRCFLWKDKEVSHEQQAD